MFNKRNICADYFFKFFKNNIWNDKIKSIGYKI